MVWNRHEYYWSYNSLDEFGIPTASARASWNKKSGAAIERENQAIELFNKFYQEAKDLPHSDFPLTKLVVFIYIYIYKCSFINLIT